jgi:ergothioneine biosynthesis protein EgtB
MVQSMRAALSVVIFPHSCEEMHMTRAQNDLTNHSPALPFELDATKTTSLAEEFKEIREQSELLVTPLSAEDSQVQSMPDTSPTKWHLAHTSWFFETFVLERFEPKFTPFDCSYRVLFNSYYEGIGDQFPRDQRSLITQPTFDAVMRYRWNIEERIQAVLQQFGTDKDLTNLIMLGLHHEQQHQELVLTDIKHALSATPQRVLYSHRRFSSAGMTPPMTWLPFDGGVVPQGYDGSRDGSFSFDNESPRHRVFLEPFQLASRPVTVGEYLAFMEDGGYQRPEVWLSFGWDWVRRSKGRAPLYWISNTTLGTWQQYTLNGIEPLDLDAPVCHLSLFEADAYARWADARLPTEAEWEHVARSTPQRPLRECNLAHRRIYQPQAARGVAPRGLMQMFGDVWEWTSSSYSPYPGYRPATGAVGEYNGKFMCNQYVLRGGSCATPFDHIRASYRNFFPAEASWQFTGVRLARSV